MVSRTRCRGITKGGERCLAPVLTGGEFCFFHDPDHTSDAAEARRLGGLRRRREGTLQGAYDLQGLTSIEDYYRLLEVVGYEALTLDNTVARGRLLLGVIQAGIKLREVGDLEERLAAVEAALGPRVVSQTRRR